MSPRQGSTPLSLKNDMPVLKLPEKVHVIENELQGTNFVSPPIEQDHESTSRFEQSPEDALPKTKIKETDKIVLDLKSAGFAAGPYRGSPEYVKTTKEKHLG